MTRAATGVRAAAVAATLLGLAALVAVASGRGLADPGGGETNVAALQDVKDVFFTVLLTVLGLVLLAVVAYLVHQSRRTTFEAPSPWDFRSLALFLLFATALALVVLERPDVLQRTFEDWGIAALQERLDPARPGAADPEAAARVEPRFHWWLAAAIVGAVAASTVGFLLWSRASRGPAGGPPEPLAGELAAAVDASLVDLDAERDPRRAVIAAYAQMERVLAAGGAARRPHEVPFEYLARVLRELAVRPEAVLALTELFERARFSRHEIDEGMREEAAQALAAVRDDLRAAA